MAKRLKIYIVGHMKKNNVPLILKVCNVFVFFLGQNLSIMCHFFFERVSPFGPEIALRYSQII